MDCTAWTLLGTIFAILGSSIAIVAFTYSFLRNFKEDMQLNMRDLKDEMRLDMRDFKGEMRLAIEAVVKRSDLLEERMFWLATGKTWEELLIAERLKRASSDGTLQN